MGTVRRMLAEAARTTSRNSSLDDKLEKLAEIVEASVEDNAKRRERTGAQRSILDLKPRWSFPEVHGRAGDGYEKFFKEFEETMRIMETNNPGGISDRETWMVLGKQVHGTVRTAYDNIFKKHERLAEQGKAIWNEAQLYSELYKEFKAYQLQFVKNRDEKLADVMESYNRLRRAKDEDFTSWRLRWERKLADLEEMGIQKGEQELLIECLSRVGSRAHDEIRADRRMYQDDEKNKSGFPEPRGPKTWQEADEVARRIEKDRRISRVYTGGNTPWSRSGGIDLDKDYIYVPEEDQHVPKEDYYADVGGIRTNPSKGKGLGRSKGKGGKGRRTDGTKGTQFKKNTMKIADCYQIKAGESRCSRPNCKYYPCVKSSQRSGGLNDPWNEGLDVHPEYSASSDLQGQENRTCSSHHLDTCVDLHESRHGRESPLSISTRLATLVRLSVYPSLLDLPTFFPNEVSRM